MLSKPIATDPELLERLRRAAEEVKRMSPEEFQAMHEKQRASWVRANMPTGDPSWD